MPRRHQIEPGQPFEQPEPELPVPDAHIDSQQWNAIAENIREPAERIGYSLTQLVRSFRDDGYSDEQIMQGISQYVNQTPLLRNMQHVRGSELEQAVVVWGEKTHGVDLDLREVVHIPNSSRAEKFDQQIALAQGAAMTEGERVRFVRNNPLYHAKEAMVYGLLSKGDKLDIIAEHRYPALKTDSQTRQIQVIEGNRLLAAFEYVPGQEAAPYRLRDRLRGYPRPEPVSATVQIKLWPDEQEMKELTAEQFVAWTASQKNNAQHNYEARTNMFMVEHLISSVDRLLSKAYDDMNGQRFNL